MLNICATRQAYRNKQIRHTGLVLSSQNPADGVTKPKATEASYDFFNTGHRIINVKQWIIPDLQ